MRFILDTGAENTILSKRDVSEILGMQYSREFSILGADMKTNLTAFLVRNNKIQFGNLSFPNRHLLVLKEDYLNIDEFVGVQIHGVLGADIIRNFTIKIDFKKGVIRFYVPNKFNAPKKNYLKIPLEISKGKPYINTNISFSKDNQLAIKLLLDTGANLPLLIYTDTNPKIVLPKNYIKGYLGMGLGGLIEGYMSRINQIKINSYFFNNLIVNFQEISDIIEPENLNGRDGIMGNVLISRFTIILDYTNQHLYLKPSKKYNRGFDFDKSGLVIIASGAKLKDFTISKVMENSPALEAGIQDGDIIKRLNGQSSSNLDLRIILRKLQKKEGKKIKLVIERNGKKIKKTFRLRNLI